MKFLDENTKISLALVVVMIGGSGWLTNVYAEVRSSSAKLVTQQQNIDQLSQELSQVQRDLAVIHEIVKRIDRHTTR